MYQEIEAIKATIIFLGVQSVMLVMESEEFFWLGKMSGNIREYYEG